MSVNWSRYGLAPAARTTFLGALFLFVVTIVIGILNGIDVYEPDHDILLSHVHAGTLGWLTLGVAGVAFLLFSKDRTVGSDEAKKVGMLAKAMTTAIVLYVGAFFLGDSVFDDRIQRPLFGTLLLVVVVWFLAWLLGANKRYDGKSVTRLGVILAWISLIIGAVFGIALGLYTSNGEVPGLSDEVAGRIAEAHPPALVVGFLLLASFALIEWLLDDGKGWTRSGSIEMWLLFVAGIVLTIAFVAGLEEELAGPANLLMIVAAIMLLVRKRGMLMPSGWKGAGAGVFARLSVLFLLFYLVLLTVIIVQFINGSMDVDALTESQKGQVLTLDHLMFIGVMTNAFFGILAMHAASDRVRTANRIVVWGVNVGITGFALGLITTTQVLKRVSSPILGLALLYGIAVYFRELRSSTTETA